MKTFFATFLILIAVSAGAGTITWDVPTITGATVTLIPDEKRCVPSDIAIAAWADAMSSIPRSLSGVISYTAECDPCKCSVNGMAACYEFMAVRERDRENRTEQARALVERAKKYGICR